MQLNMQLGKEKKFQACRDSNPDLCDTGAALYRRERERFRASCWEDSFETKHKCSARQIPLSLKPTKAFCVIAHSVLL